MRKNLALLSVFGLLLAPSVGLAEVPAPPVLSTLEPGGFRDIAQDLTINVVLVGYEAGAEIDEAVFLGELPATYRPINIYPSIWKGYRDFLGLTFNFDYNLVYADSAFENAFFGYLSSIAVPKPLTLYQNLYNYQSARSLTLTSNYWIDAPSVEQWLADNAQPALGVDTSQYTVFFINWYGRDDFKPHVYTKVDEPDPDTGYNFGASLDSRKLIAWGGTTADDEESGLGSLHRMWFYDLSAGPEAWSYNWNLDSADVNYDGVLDYRMPPVWEYGNLSAYRPFDNLSGDLGKVARYVAIDNLFTASTAYKPALSPPGLPESLQLDINVFQIDPNEDGTAWFDVALIDAELNELQPLKTISSELNSIEFGPHFDMVYQCFYDYQSCFGYRMFGVAIADLFLYFSDHILQFLEGDGDYEIPVFAFNVPNELHTWVLGFADGNWSDGTQSFVFEWDSPLWRNYGYGFTTTTIHEVGHHLGMDHPYEGYDYERDVDVYGGGEFYFAYSGDEVNSVMSYIDLNWDFGQFDRDNMDRWLTSTYINQANVILADIYASPQAWQVGALLSAADGHAAAALTAYASMNYPGAVFEAKAAYGNVLSAAAQIYVPVDTRSWQADYKAMGRNGKFVDNVVYQRLLP